MSTLFGCSQGSDRITNTISPSPTNLTATNSRNAQKPATKTAIISIEGEKTEILLKLYDEASVFTTYYPAQDLIAESVASGEGTSTRFYAHGDIKNEAASVQIFRPNDTTTIEELKHWMKGNRGLLATRWQIVDATPDTSYPWAKEKIVFTQAENNIIGTVYLGESQGKAFYVVTHYPAEYGDGFAPTDLILQNLEI